MFKRPQLILCFLFYILIAGFPFYLSLPIPIANWNSWVLFITGAVIVWYSWETKKLREETILQTDLQMLPIITVTMTHNNISVYNIGNFPAFNLKLLFPNIPQCSISIDYIFWGYLEKQSGWTICNFELYKNNNRIISVPEIFSLMRTNKTKIVIECENIKKKKYKFSFSAPDCDSKSIKPTEPHQLKFEGYSN